MPAPTKAKESQAFPALSLDGMFLLTPDQHRTVAKDLRRQVNDPKAQELATAHEKLAVAIQKHLHQAAESPYLRDMHARGITPARTGTWHAVLFLPHGQAEAR
jgi:hypothetical protein